eukprot:m.21505 g.21505  ORF g.21505 m.21505 type:complete len:318 (+) comp6442_c0_seq2:302-1255(+)
MARPPDDTIALVVPSFFVEVEEPTPSPMPIPGFAEPADVFRHDDPDPPFQFLRPMLLQREEDMAVEQERQAIPRCVSVVPEHYANYIDIFPVAETVKHIFCLDDDPVDDILQSLTNPFAENAGGITWTFVRKVRPLTTKRNGRRDVAGIPWSILSVGDVERVEAAGGSPTPSKARRRGRGRAGGRGSGASAPDGRNKTHNNSDDGPTHFRVRKNYVFDGQGNVRAEVDFGCSANPTLHVHQLIAGELDHAAPSSEHHCLPWRHCPWFFSAFPDMRKLGNSGDVLSVPDIKDTRDGDFVWCSVDAPCDLDLFLDDLDL